MAGVAFVTADKYINGEKKNCFFVATVQDDGFMYFNDENMYRLYKDKKTLQMFYFPKQIWIGTEILQNIHGVEFNPQSMLDDINHNNASGGATATDANIEAACQWAESVASAENVTYSQARPGHLKDPDNFTYGDCSGFVITAMYVGGFDAESTYTGDMRAGFTALGFEWIPGSYFDASDLQRGDIQLNEVNHTNLYIGNNKDADCGATPCRIITHDPNCYGLGWDGILRWNG